MSAATTPLLLPSQSLTVRNPWALVPPIGNLDAYISAVNRIPLLTPQEEIEFARKLRDGGDLEAAGRMVLSHLRRWFPSRASTWATACRRAT
jgi:RNA polymerase sigma-32 factor